ncbi:cytochrome oxidase assembly protein [Aeromicrobium sp. Root236]|uniref:COX15/CtaA family protein n=1 Tax=Aeromicrobium sp. Root236 TaxID=1736498 RepID=UPI0006F3F042|nr:COX15/CtaA family protein [Aeromicrobium sp. Root236]KRC63636.1 cytochrome oxidase assembly protein [Aeromicrobium sp. Root236]
MGVTQSLRTPQRADVERWAWAAVVANIVIVLTGGLVRLTDSGLGCPTWPRCTDSSFVPHRALGVHGVIEFGNRMLTYVLIAVVIATFVAVWRWAGTTRDLRRLAALIALGVPFQGVIGGITVLTDLNPWVVSLHMILSMLLVAASMLLVVRVRGTNHLAWPAYAKQVVLATYVVLWAAVYLGTMVTGAGPHAGDAEAPRNGLDPHVMSHVHAASVYLLVALTVAACVILRRTPAARIAGILLLVELAQGTIGFVQYLTDLPIALVAIHLVGAAALIAGGTRLLVTVVSSSSPLGTAAASRPVRPTRSR